MKFLRRLAAIFRPTPAPVTHTFSDLDRQFMSAMMETAFNRSRGLEKSAN